MLLYIMTGVDFEIKTMTHFRERVATFGSASYTNGRIDNKDEKKKEIKRLNFGKYIFKAAEKPYRIKQAQVNRELKRRLSLDDVHKNYIKYIQERSDSDMIKEKIKKWRENVLAIVPRYFSARYDREKDIVEIEFLSEVGNVNKLYSETSVLQVRENVKRNTNTLRKLGFLSDEPLIITLSRSQYKDFFQYDLKDLKGKIDAKLKLYGKDKEK